MTNALKIIATSGSTEKAGGVGFSWWLHNFASTPVYFYNDEVLDISMAAYRQITVQTNLQSKSFLYDSLKVDAIPAIPIGADGVLSGGMIISIDILHAHSDTDTRILSLLNSRLAKIYYKYIDNAAAYKIFILDPNFVTTYKFGYKAARVITQIRGYETANFVRITEDI